MKISLMILTILFLECEIQKKKFLLEKIVYTRLHHRFEWILMLENILKILMFW